MVGDGCDHPSRAALERNNAWMSGGNFFLDSFGAFRISRLGQKDKKSQRKTFFTSLQFGEFSVRFFIKETSLLVQLKNLLSKLL